MGLTASARRQTRKRCEEISLDDQHHLLCTMGNTTRTFSTLPLSYYPPKCNAVGDTSKPSCNLSLSRSPLSIGRHLVERASRNREQNQSRDQIYHRHRATTAPPHHEIFRSSRFAATACYRRGTNTNLHASQFLAIQITLSSLHNQPAQ